MWKPMGPKRHINQLQYIDYLDPNVNKKLLEEKKKDNTKKHKKTTGNWVLEI